MLNAFKKPYFVLVVLLVVIIVVVLGKNVKDSLFFSNRQRINIVIYNKDTPYYYSISTIDNLHYAVPFGADQEILLPGGYGKYRVGALRKLVHLEKKPELMQRAFSYATGTFVDYYFFPRSVEIYYGKNIAGIAPVFSVKDIVTMYSNASTIDRIYIAMRLIGKQVQDFRTIHFNAAFKKTTQGYWYQKIFRSEQKNIQIQYARSWLTASEVGEIIEGNGIRVADITKENSNGRKCVIKEDTSAHSASARALSRFFHCDIMRDKTGIYDIILMLGEKEEEW